MCIDVADASKSVLSVLFLQCSGLVNSVDVVAVSVKVYTCTSVSLSNIGRLVSNIVQTPLPCVSLSVFSSVSSGQCKQYVYISPPLSGDC